MGQDGDGTGGVMLPSAHKQYLLAISNAATAPPLTQEVTFQDMHLVFELPCLLGPRDRGWDSSVGGPGVESIWLVCPRGLPSSPASIPAKASAAPGGTREFYPV